MNTGQTMLSVGAIILLSTVILRVNSSFLTTNESLMDSKFGVLATSLAVSVIEEANGKYFDQNTNSNPLTAADLGQLSDPDSLKWEEDDLIRDDFDDYNGYVSIIDTIPSAVFEVKAFVCYVNANDLQTPSNVKTWHKKLTVEVTSKKSLTDTVIPRDTIRYSSVFSYWYF